MKAEKLSFALCPETCPKVNEHFENTFDEIVTAFSLDEINQEILYNLLVEVLSDKIKDDGTLLLRNALNTACDQIIELKSKIEDLNYELRGSNSQ